MIIFSTKNIFLHHEKSLFFTMIFYTLENFLHSDDSFLHNQKYVITTYLWKKNPCMIKIFSLYYEKYFSYMMKIIFSNDKKHFHNLESIFPRDKNILLQFEKFFSHIMKNTFPKNEIVYTIKNIFSIIMTPRFFFMIKLILYTQWNIAFQHVKIFFCRLKNILSKRWKIFFIQLKFFHHVKNYFSSCIKNFWWCR